MHGGGGCQELAAVGDTDAQVGVERPAFHVLGVLVRDHQDSGSRRQDTTQLRGVEHSLDGTVDDEIGGAQGAHGRRVVGDGLGGARRTDWQRTPIGWRGEHDLDGPHSAAAELGGVPLNPLPFGAHIASSSS